MSATPEVWRQVEKRVQQRVNSHKKRHTRYWKLKGDEAKTAVLQGATARLFAVDALFPYALRKRLAPRPLVVKGVPAGWVGYWRPVNSTQWEAWLKVHREYIENGRFFYEKSEAIDALIDTCIDAERHAYVSATSDVGGDEKLDPTTQEALRRYTEAGQAFATEPSREYEQRKQLEAEAEALDAREKQDAEENEKLRDAVYAYSRKLPVKQRRALKLVCTDLSLRGCDIATKCGVAPSTVSKIRANVEELADQILTIPPEEGVSTPETHDASVERDASVDQIADAGEVEGTEVDATADLSAATMHSDALDMAWNLRAPDVDADVSEATLHNYARRNSGNGFGSQWGKGRSRVELTTGSRYGGKFSNPAEIALRAERERMKDYSESEMKAMQAMAEQFGVDLQGLLKSAATHRALRLQQAEEAREAAEAARKAANQLRRAAFLLDKSAEEIAEFRAWAAPWCEALGSDVDAILGVPIAPKSADETLAAAIWTKENGK